MKPDALHAETDARDGLREAIAALETAQQSGRGWAVAEAHLGLARCYSALGALGLH